MRVTGEIVIHRPLVDVFDFATDERNEPLYNPAMVRAEMTTPGPIGPGTRFTATIRSLGRSVPMSVEVTAYERPTWFGSMSRMRLMTATGTLGFSKVPGGTLMRWDWHVQPHGALRVLGPLAGVIGRTQERARWTRMKRLLESTRLSPSRYRVMTASTSTAE